MPEKYKNKYRIPSARLQNWDYGWNGAYFITICTHNREHYFGKIINNKIINKNYKTSSEGFEPPITGSEVQYHIQTKPRAHSYYVITTLLHIIILYIYLMVGI